MEEPGDPCEDDEVCDEAAGSAPVTSTSAEHSHLVRPARRAATRSDLAPTHLAARPAGDAETEDLSI